MKNTSPIGLISYDTDLKKKKIDETNSSECELLLYGYIPFLEALEEEIKLEMPSRSSSGRPTRSTNYDKCDRIIRRSGLSNREAEKGNELKDVDLQF